MTVWTDRPLLALHLPRDYRKTVTVYACYKRYEQRLESPLAGKQLPGAFQIRQSYADDLFYLLNRTRNFDATDPRDKLFALLGLTRGLSADLTVADYKRPVRDVFLELAETAITRSHSLDITSLGSSPSSTYSTDGLPSWVPDFSSK